MQIIDFHTHAFPDAIVNKAMNGLSEMANTTPCLDGKISSLINSMDTSKISQSIICNIATKPDQFFPILEWSKEIRSSKIIPFPSFHPKDPDPIEKINIIAHEGFKGIKLHSYYQNFKINDQSMFPAYEKIQDLDLIILFHAGFDISFERYQMSNAKMFKEIIKLFPNLKIVAAHLGGWQDWEKAYNELVGEKIFLDTSYALNKQENPFVEKFLNEHLEDYLLFGTDSPWACQKQTAETLTKFKLPKNKEHKILFENAKNLLNI